MEDEKRQGGSAEPGVSRREFPVAAGGIALAAGGAAMAADTPPAGPVEAPSPGGYPPPKFKPSWKKPQVNRGLARDFIIYAHSDLKMVEELLAKEPALLNASIDWGGGDWETALGGASHMGRRDIVAFLLSKGARIDLFCAAMLGQLEAVKAFLAFQPSLIDARGPHGFSLHFHAQVGGKDSEKLLDYLQAVKKVELKPVPFLQKG